LKHEQRIWIASASRLRRATGRRGPSGGAYTLNFHLWTDDEHRPWGFRVRVPNGSPTGVVGFREGYEE
jgi:hypothetical protein